ncbi:MAG: TatD family hydrolase [Patescibacteria group bacterium]
MEIKYFDAHTHAHFPVYGDDVNLMVKRAADAGVGFITVGTSKSTSADAVSFAEKHEHVWACIGLYPGHTVDSSRDEDEYGISEKKDIIPAEPFDHDFFKTLAESKKVVAVGECGLDLLYGETEEKMETQKNEFIKQIKFSNEIEKPLMIHCRDLYKELAQLLKIHGTKKSPIIHSFRGTVEEAKIFLELGCYFTFGGVITFPPKKNGILYAEVINEIPIDHLLSETDAPWVAPVPYRGKRNESAYVVEVVKKLAEIKNVSEEAMREQILENTKSTFEIKLS